MLKSTRAVLLLRLIVRFGSIAACCPGLLFAGAQELNPAMPVQREIGRGEMHAYRLTVPARHYIRLSADQRGVDLELTLLDSGGRRIRSIDSSPHGNESLSFLARTAETIRLEIRAVQHHKMAGGYLARIDALRSPLSEDLRRFEAEGLLSQGIALIVQDTGETLRAAIEPLEKSAALWRTVRDPEMEGRALKFANIALHKLGDYEKAHTYAERSAAITRGIAHAHADALEQAALLYGHFRDLRGALKLYLRLERLWRENGDQWCEAMALGRQASTLRQLGESKRALDLHLRALEMRSPLTDEHEVVGLIHSVGLDHLGLEQYDLAISWFLRAKSLYESRQDRRGEAASLTDVGGAYLRMGRREDALEYFHRTLPLRRTLGDAPAEAELLREIANIQRLSGRFPEALEAIANAEEVYESMRARVTTPERRAAFFPGISIVKVREQILLAIHERDPTAGHDRSAFEAIDRARARTLIERFKPSGFEWPDLAAIQRGLLDRDTVLISYHDDHVWAITNESLTIYSLPEVSELEPLVSRAYRLLTERNHRLPNESAAARRDRVASAETGFREAAARLSQAILSPVLAHLAGKKRLLIVRGGALHLVPFAALPHPGSGLPLIATHEIATLPSASSLLLLREVWKSRPPAPHVVAVLADPVFDAKDPRVRPGEKAMAASAPEDALTRSLNAVGLHGIPRVPFTRKEAQAIGRLSQPEDSLELLDFSANRDALLSGQLSDYRIVHIATHALMNPEDTALTGLVLSAVKPDGSPRKSFLPLSEIHKLELPADLVVLSACRTALGKDLSREGVMSLSRAFLDAGASRVIASLWKVDDEATAALMTHFYENLLAPRRLTPSAALRAAQLAVSQERRWSSPYYWAGFSLYGEFQ